MKEFLASKMVSCRAKIGNRPISYSDKGLWQRVASVEGMKESSGRASVYMFPDGEWKEVDDLTAAMLKVRNANTLATIDNGVYLMSPDRFIQVRDKLADMNNERVQRATGHDWHEAVNRARLALNGRFDAERYNRESFIESFTCECRIDRHFKADELLSAYEGAMDALVQEAKSGLMAKYGELERAGRESVAGKVIEPLKTLHDKLVACYRGEAKRFSEGLFSNVMSAFDEVVGSLPDCQLRDSLVGKLAMPIAHIVSESRFRESFKECPNSAVEPAKAIVDAINLVGEVVNADMPERVVAPVKMTGMEMLASVFA